MQATKGNLRFDVGDYNLGALLLRHKLIVVQRPWVTQKHFRWHKKPKIKCKNRHTEYDLAGNAQKEKETPS